MELAMACATFGLVLGGIVGGPVAQRLITRHRLSAAGAAQPGAVAGAEAPAVAALNPSNFLSTLLLLLLCVYAGGWLARAAEGSVLTLPAFVWTLFCGVVLRNLLGLGGRARVDDGAIATLGS